jgi:signal transduction histidine kinase
LGAREQRALDGLRSQARQLARLAEEVLHIARLETGMVQLRRSPLEMGTFLKALVREEKANERILVSVPRESVTVNADPELLGSCIDNLLRNALKYSPQTAAVEVELRAENGSAVVEVRDQGIGLSQEDLASLFKKYGRLVNERTSGIEGVGLGLYLTKLLVEAHGGSLSAASPGPYQGSTFTIAIPHE